MADMDMPALTPRDDDPWHLATPLQLLTLLERLDRGPLAGRRWARQQLLRHPHHSHETHPDTAPADPGHVRAGRRTRG